MAQFMSYQDREITTQGLARLMTKAASKQTFFTVRFLVDRERVADAYQAYAYFRWVDDQLDQHLHDKQERLAFIERQQMLVRCGYQHKWPSELTLEESLLNPLIQNDQSIHSGLHSYIHNMMAVMAFDACRQGQVIHEQELATYSQHLSTAVTDALHHFIGHDATAPQCTTRYFAATAAHITHMLRDTVADIADGYFNIPYEFLHLWRIDPCNVESNGYRVWIKNRVQLARDYFARGKHYLSQIKNFRCRLAASAYMVRFEDILDIIERDDYRLRPSYQPCPSASSGLKLAGLLFQ